MSIMSLSSRIAAKFEAAVASGHLIFTESTTSKDVVNGIQYLYTFAPALAVKPTGGLKKSNPNLKGSPWYPTPETELTVEDDYLGDFRIVLNKFAVVPQHFLLVTKELESQNAPLSPSQLEASFGLLNTVESETSKRHVGFFNCGPESGASVPHKHIQFLALEPDFVPFVDEMVKLNLDWKDGQRPLSDTRASFCHFIVPVPANPTTEILGSRYSTLMSRVLTVLRAQEVPSISYNFVFTRDWMMATPRRAESYQGRSINSVGTIGMLLAKSQEDLAFFKELGPDTLLQNLACRPIDLDQKEGEYDY